MRKPSKRWIALSSATTISVAGLAVPTAAAANDEAPPAWPVVRQNASSYTLDGFTIGYLPPRLEEHGLNAKSATDGHGGRTSDITWMEGPDEVYGKIEVLRDGGITSLADLRDAQYGHLDADQLREIDNNDRDTYLSEGTGDLFWVEEPGLAVTIYLRPETWDSGELTRMAASNERQEETEPQGGRAGDPQSPEDGAGADGFETGRPEAVDAPEGGTTREAPHANPGAPRTLEGGAPEDEQPAAGHGDGAHARQELPPDVSEPEVRRCLAGQVIGATPGNTEETALDAGAVAASEARFAELWSATVETDRKDAVNACAERFGIDPSVVEAITERTGGETPPGGARFRDALAWTLPSAPMNH
ncbi:hypothetical protein [Allosalinactinospora lopnorensis]|uniref:hypothetical protein n=1 Tax=Allosalinactinospora lopnorensis TaxID=1352348 RepID=UPI000697C266|nr:hypothetical protein [Allosalinactinospora lopnorensis]